MNAKKINQSILILSLALGMGTVIISTTANAAIEAALPSTAMNAKNRIQASDSALQSVLAASQARNIKQMKSILLQNGFTPEQLNNAQIVIDDQTGGASPGKRKIQIEIEVKLSKPPIIKIIIKF